MSKKQNITTTMDDELWDYYSGLPSPKWYEQQSKLNEKVDNDRGASDTNVVREDKTKAQKHLGSIKQVI